MIKQKVQDEINDQIQAEFQSAWLYLAYAAWFEDKNLEGFAHWMRLQWQEEQAHGMKFYNHMLSRGGKVELQELDKPIADAENSEEVFEKVLEHERYITKRIHSLYDLAKDEGDYPLQTLLHWFIDEQVEEEENAERILERLKLMGDDNASLYMLDQELAGRSADEDA
ncbi:ferritin [Fodinibius saliphilus]|uniref:ferritin n=1 Tax=Fodinibius saliphilus TaxID=1920650 RepID=UPI0011081B77|nr:ferritin [Fodinibius saliphilus]